MSIYLSDAVYFNSSSGKIHHGNILVENDPERGWRFTDEGPLPDSRVISCKNRLVLDGLICGHHHIYSALARGMPAPPRVPSNFAEILELIWWRLDKCLDSEMIRASALAASIECIKCGVTGIVDHHASPNAISNSLGIIGEAIDEAGISHVLCLELSDRDGEERAMEGLEETDSYLSSGKPGMVGLHASFTVGEKLLSEAVKMANLHGSGVHVHVAEGDVDQEKCLADYGKRVIERYSDAGLLDLEGSILVHCIHLDDNERELLANSPVFIAHNPESNQKNAVGTFSWRGLDPSRVLLGTDGMHGDMIRSARASFLTGKASGMGTDPQTGLNSLWNNRRFLEKYHPGACRRNDLVIIDYDPPSPLDEDNFTGHFLFGFDSRQVETVIAGGRIVMENRIISSLDERETMRFCREQAERLWTAMTCPGT